MSEVLNNRKDASSTAKMQGAVISNVNTPDERQQVFRVPMRKSGELTLISTFVYP